VSDDLQKIKQQILALVESNKAGIAYSKLTLIEGLKGDCCLGHPRFPIVHYWEGLSETAAEAILELIREGKLRHEPTDALTYVAHGKTLDLPIFTIEHVPKAAQLGTPHWMPVLLLKND
jgi:hypothetical protein